MLPPVKKPELAGKFAHITRLLSDYAVTPAQLGERWGYSVSRLSNARGTEQSPIPYWITPTGGIRYWMREVLAAELAGARGPLSLDRVETELLQMPEVSDDLSAAIMARLRAVMEPQRE